MLSLASALRVVEVSLGEAITSDELTRAIAEKKAGIEAYFYPFINKNIIAQMRHGKLTRLGSGRLKPAQNYREIHDCIIGANASCQILELKGPAPFNYLLGGASSNKDIEQEEQAGQNRSIFHDLEAKKECLLRAYKSHFKRGKNKMHIYPDSHIGDILKIKKRVNTGDVVSGFAVAILQISEPNMDYEAAIKEMMQCFSLSVGTAEGEGPWVPLSQLVGVLNERFGTDFKPADQLFFDSIKEDAVSDSGLRQAAMANTIEFRICLPESTRRTLYRSDGTERRNRGEVYE